LPPAEIRQKTAGKSLISLDQGVAQRVAVQPDPGVLVESMPQGQQAPAVAVPLAGERGRRCPLGHAAEDHQDLEGAPLDPLKEGPGPGVEDASAGAALVVQDRLAVSATDAQVVPFSAARTSQALGVEPFDESGGASVLIEGVDQGKIPGRDLHANKLSRTIVSRLRTPPSEAIIKRMSTELAS
jgi:hypothetical protein